MAASYIPPAGNEVYRGPMDWKAAPQFQSTTYFYEGANTTTYDLPHSNVFVHVMIAASNRGLAIAYKWADTATAVWINRKHDTWKGWERVDKNA